jgi:hypothetical protein
VPPATFAGLVFLKPNRARLSRGVAPSTPQHCFSGVAFMKRIRLVLVMPLVLWVCSGAAMVQYGYPSGYGGYGWGG